MSAQPLFLHRLPFGAPAVVAGLLIALVPPAGAATLTMQGWYQGQGNKVTVTNPSYQGLAGGFRGELSGLSDQRFNLRDLEMYCVDLLQTINPAAGTSYSVKMDGEPGTTTFVIKPIEQVFDAGRVERLSQLISYVGATPALVSNAAQSTSLQLAIWNVLYDNDSSLSAYAGAQFSDSSSYRHLAGDLLVQSAGFRVDRQLYVMTSTTRQDQLFWLDVQQVPEPAGLALAVAALGGMAVARRRVRR